MADLEALSGLIARGHDHLQRVGSLGLALDLSEGRGDRGVGELDLEQEPWPAVAHNQEVHLAFLFVA